MAIWSLLMSMCSSPGYIPFGYSYDEQRLSKIVIALFRFINTHRDVPIIKQAEGDESVKRYQTFACTIPLTIGYQGNNTTE